ncbi:hypothetical protein [Desmonostoc muscorum]|nr:hypothetical protein [Desmonostoc muscorum]
MNKPNEELELQGKLLIMPTSTIDNRDAVAIQAARVGVAICDR